MMTCCTFEKPVRNSSLTEQHVFLILVHRESHSLHHVSYTFKTELSNKQTSRPATAKSLLEKWRSVILKKGNTEKQRMTNYKHHMLCFYCKCFNHCQDECRNWIQDNQPCTDNKGRKYWPRRYTDEEMTHRPVSLISALTEYVNPLSGNRLVLLQLILNLCIASLATCNKLCKIFAPGEKIHQKINMKTGNQTTSWLSDTDGPITCMNK